MHRVGPIIIAVQLKEKHLPSDLFPVTPEQVKYGPNKSSTILPDNSEHFHAGHIQQWGSFPLIILSTTVVLILYSYIL